MPLKWKIFFGLNFVLSLPALSGFVLLVVDEVRSHYNREDYLVVSIFLLSLLLITLDGLLNIYLLQRFFPDKLIPTGIKRLNAAALILNWLIAAALLVYLIYLGSLVFSYEYQPGDGNRKLALTIICIYWIIQVVVLIMQGQLTRTIGRNNRDRMHSLIDSIGHQ